MKKEEILKALAEAGVNTEGMEALKNEVLSSMLQTVTTLSQTNEQLNEQLTKTEEAAPTAKAHVVKLGKDEYELIVPQSTLNGKLISAATLKSNSEELKQLVAMGSGAIKKI